VSVNEKGLVAVLPDQRVQCDERPATLKLRDGPVLEGPTTDGPRPREDWKRDPGSPHLQCIVREHSSNGPMDAGSRSRLGHVSSYRERKKERAPGIQ